MSWGLIYFNSLLSTQKSVLAPGSWQGAGARLFWLPVCSRWVPGVLVGPKVLLFSRRLVFLSLLKCDGYDVFEMQTLQACPGLFLSAGSMCYPAQVALGIPADGGGCCWLTQFMNQRRFWCVLRLPSAARMGALPQASARLSALPPLARGSRHPGERQSRGSGCSQDPSAPRPAEPRSYCRGGV